MFGWSVTTSSLPRSAPAASSATSPTPTERVRLTELHRFTDPAEGAASLALRDGRPEALGFYLDQQRIHVGDLTALTEEVFSAWQTDRSSGLDAIMLAPTRELVSQLNQRARAHRLAAEPDSNQRDAWRLAMLADGNPASVGEQVITRTNNRTLRITATDWVKNGDRWTVLKVSRGGDLTVRHHRNGRTVRLPANYVRSRLSWATPPPCTPRKGSPPTPCTAWPPVRSPGSSCTPC